MTDTNSQAQNANQEAAAQQANRADSLIEYPSQFPIKVVGVNEAGYKDAIVEIARKFDSEFDEKNIELKESGGGKYIGITITITATSREQLDDLYKALSTHPLSRWVL